MKFFYVRITKCACQTLHKIFTSKPVSDFYIDAVKNKSLSRSPIDKALGLTLNEFRLPPNCLSVSFVRNPFDRAISAYYYSRSRPKIFGYLADPKLTFLSFLHLTRDLLNEGIPSKQIVSYRHLLPQSNFLLHQGSPFIDFIGRVEHLDAHLSELSALILKRSSLCPRERGNVKFIKAPQLNRSPRPKQAMKEFKKRSLLVEEVTTTSTTTTTTQAYSNPECINLVKQIYSADLRRFNYSLEKNPELPIINHNY